CARSANGGTRSTRTTSSVAASRPERRASFAPLLAPEAQVRGARLEIRAEGVDVETAPARVAPVHGEPFRRAPRLDVDEHALDAAFMERAMAAVRGDVAQQRAAVDARAAVPDEDAAHVRLAGDRAVAAEQVRVQRLLDDLAARTGEERRVDLPRVAGD